MTDRELLELAAKANWSDELDDTSIRWGEFDDCILFIHADNQDHNGVDREYRWDPINDDDDALRLAVKLKMSITRYDNLVEIDEIEQEWSGDWVADTRRAIVRAAAEIGRAMP